MPLPFDIVTSGGKKRMTINKEGITVDSEFTPQVDNKGNYLKKITIQ